MNQEWQNQYNLHTCPVCGKRFIPAPQHSYRVQPHSGAPVCSYTCMMVCRRKAEAKKEKEGRADE